MSDLLRDFEAAFGDGVRDPESRLEAAAGAADAEPEPGPDAASVPEAEPEAEAGPEPLGVALPVTGNADVDAAVARLADADELPTAGHVEVYEDVHRGLRDALTALDENRS
ncbi:hypothetical protein SAMN05216251_13445 [Actinacidiphila alni]|uniref:Uncharacterized protein n=1 Tax=Actinacidiphila alni TaxID=380248 RepID=A0A1I2MBA2_9ACTN|nr:hypothetical protein SAMN05216251_13445 [Actinacidiphila alni]